MAAGSTLTPCLRCAIRQSGAILLYLADKAGATPTPEARAAAAKWVLWANATYCPAVFNPAQRGAKLPAFLATLQSILAAQPYVLGQQFGVADVAVAAYLAYTTMFFPDTKAVFKQYPAVAAYMAAIEARPAFHATIGSE